MATKPQINIPEISTKIEAIMGASSGGADTIASILKTFVSVVKSELQQNNKVYIHGMGTFSRYTRQTYTMIGQFGATKGQTLTIPASNRASFRASTEYLSL